MTNYEKKRKDIDKITRLGVSFAIDKKSNQVVLCGDILCDNCLFNYTYCDSAKYQWANEEYIAPEVDWSKVPVDTKIWVRDDPESDWYPRHFCKYENEIVYAWIDGMTSFSTSDAISWTYAELV